MSTTETGKIHEKSITHQFICTYIVVVSWRSSWHFFLTLFVLQQANAGYYQASYSSEGNEVTIVGPSGVTWHTGYKKSSDGWYGGGGASSDPPGGPRMASALGPGFVSCSGPITITFSWKPSFEGDPEQPPASVIINEEAWASWVGDYGGCANGLGNTPPEEVLGGISSGNKLSVKSNPGYSFQSTTSPISPSASAVVSMTSPYLTAAGAAVSVRATATPVRLVISGALKDPRWQYSCMVGNRLHAVLDTGGYSQTNWAWPFPAGFFHHVDWGSLQSSASFPGEFNYTYRRIIDHTSSQRGLSSFDLIYEMNSSGKAMGSADIVYNGVTIGRVQGESLLEVFTPYVYYGRNVNTVQWNGVNPGAFMSASGPQNPSWSTGPFDSGIYFEGRLGEPSRFNSSGHGAWGFVQTLIRDQDFTPISGAMIGEHSTSYMLDNTYPYGGNVLPSTPMSFSSCPQINWTAASSVDDIGPSQWTADGPQHGLDAYVNFSYARHFRMMEVYHPMNLGNGVEDIAVYDVLWDFSTFGARSGTPLPNWNSSNTGGIKPINATDQDSCNRHLQWESVANNSSATPPSADSGGSGGTGGSGTEPSAQTGGLAFNVNELPLGGSPIGQGGKARWRSK